MKIKTKDWKTCNVYETEKENATIYLAKGVLKMNEQMKR